MSSDLIELVKRRPHRPRSVANGNFLFRQGDQVRSIFLVESGAIELVRFQMDGSAIVLQRARDGMILAEASIYSGVYHCDGLSIAPTQLLEFSKATFLKELRLDRDFAGLWSAYLANQVQSLRFRNELLTRKTVTSRLDGWLAWHDEELPPKGEWKRLAAEIGVSPEALYREISKRNKL